MEENGIDIVDWDAQIYRVYSIKWFTDLITTNKNGLVNPSKWEDPFENFFLQNQCVASDGTIVSLESLSNSWYGQCWTRNSDSDAMCAYTVRIRRALEYLQPLESSFRAFMTITISFPA